MAIVARGHTDDRPFARTIYAIGAKRFSGDLIVEQNGKRYAVGWRDGLIVAAESPSPHDAPGRVALTAGLVSSTQLGDVVRIQAADPRRDPVAVLGEVARLSAEQMDAVRRRTMAHRCVRVFALESVSFVLDDVSALTPEGVAPIDARWAVYNGIRAHYSEVRVLRELGAMAGNASTFVLNAEGRTALSAFGFGEAERPVLSRLTRPVSIAVLADEHPGLSHKALGAILNALAAAGCVEIADSVDGAERGPRPHTPSVAPLGRGSASTRVAVQATPPPAGPAPARLSTAIPAASASTAAHDQTSSTRIAAQPGTSSHAHSTSTRVAVHGAPSQTQSASTRVAAQPGAPSHAHSASTRVAVHGAGPGESGSTRHHGSSSTRIPLRTPTAAATMAEQVRALIRGGLEKVSAGTNHFALLGVPQEASTDQVRAAYFELARLLHPDRIRALQLEDLGKDAQRLFAQINTAFAVLTHPKRRDEYMAILRAGGEKAVKARAAEAESKTLRLLAAEDAFRRGEMALRRDLFAEAVAAFQQAVELNPEEGEHHAGLAWATWCLAPDKSKVLTEVRRGLDRAKDLSPQSALPYLYRGRVAKHEGKDDLAHQCFEQVLELEPGNIDASAEVRLLESRRSKRDSKSNRLGGKTRKA